MSDWLWSASAAALESRFQMGPRFNGFAATALTDSIRTGLSSSLESANTSQHPPRYNSPCTRHFFLSTAIYRRVVQSHTLAWARHFQRAAEFIPQFLLASGLRVEIAVTATKQTSAHVSTQD
jgi:hypothetical protein